MRQALVSSDLINRHLGFTDIWLWIVEVPDPDVESEPELLDLNVRSAENDGLLLTLQSLNNISDHLFVRHWLDAPVAIETANRG